MKTNLKPCPFCGSEAEIQENELFNDCYEVNCTNKQCIISVVGSSKDDAANRWNTRHDEMTLKKVLLLILEFAIKILALAVLAAGVYWIFA